LYTLILYFWIPNWKTKDSATNDDKHSLTSVCSNSSLNGIFLR
jgi:hypothetical protein